MAEQALLFLKRLAGWVFCGATAIRVGRRIQVWEIDIVDEKENPICKSRLSLAVIEKNDQ